MSNIFKRKNKKLEIIKLFSFFIATFFIIFLSNCPRGCQSTINKTKINIKQGTNNILSNTGIYDFGIINPGSSTTPVIFTIENHRKENLNLTSNPKIKLSGDNSSDFIIDTSSLSSMIPSGSSSTFSITFNPKLSGNKKASISIDNNLDENPYSFSINGIAPPKMVIVGAGVFDMGNEELEIATPVHVVYLSSFYIGKYEVTYELWESVRAWSVKNGYIYGHNGVQGKGGRAKTTSQHPVTSINWYDAVVWCNALSERAGLMLVYYTESSKKNVYKNSSKYINIKNEWVKWNANGYRLPTEAEFEYTMRNKGETKGFVYSGSESIGRVAWYNKNSNSTHPVGKKRANELRTYDI